MEIRRGISFPFRFNSRGGVAISESNYYDDAHTKESITQILLTSIHSREMNPEFGSAIKNTIFQGNNPSYDTIAINYIKEALARWEPEITVKDVQIIREKSTVTIQVTYTNRRTYKTTSISIPVGGENNE